jgi:formylglycine-generating enzyme required for sulfatase activity
LPDLAWCEVPAGPFLLGANEGEEAWDDEKPQHDLTLPTFYIARYPVTNAQYAPFVAAGGYDEPRWWSEAGWAWRTGAEPDLSQIPDEKLRQDYAKWLANRPVERRHEPFWWGEAPWNLANHPVVGVTWYEAMAYCAWINEQLTMSNEQGDVGQEIAGWPAEVVAGLAAGRWRVRLPAEAEWEKAAGWDPAAGRKRVYAWGDDWDESKANVAEKIGRTSAVGIFPAGAAAGGALDMTGNVWEWTLSAWGSFDYNKPGFRYPFEAAGPQTGPGGREAVDTPGFRAVRGGSWYDYQRNARVSFRNYLHPDDFNYLTSFRVVVAPV